MLDEYRVTMGAKVNTVMLKNLKDSNQVWLFFFRFRGLNQTDNNVIRNFKKCNKSFNKKIKEIIN